MPPSSTYEGSLVFGRVGVGKESSAKAIPTLPASNQTPKGIIEGM